MNWRNNIENKDTRQKLYYLEHISNFSYNNCNQCRQSHTHTHPHIKIHTHSNIHTHTFFWPIQLQFKPYESFWYFDRHNSVIFKRLLCLYYLRHLPYILNKKFLLGCFIFVLLLTHWIEGRNYTRNTKITLCCNTKCLVSRGWEGLENSPKPSQYFIL